LQLFTSFFNVSSTDVSLDASEQFHLMCSGYIAEVASGHLDLKKKKNHVLGSEGCSWELVFGVF